MAAKGAEKKKKKKKPLEGGKERYEMNREDNPWRQMKWSSAPFSFRGCSAVRGD